MTLKDEASTITVLSNVIRRLVQTLLQLNRSTTKEPKRGSWARASDASSTHFVPAARWIFLLFPEQSGAPNYILLSFSLPLSVSFSLSLLPSDAALAEKEHRTFCRSRVYFVYERGRERTKLHHLFTFFTYVRVHPKSWTKWTTLRPRDSNTPPEQSRITSEMHEPNTIRIVISENSSLSFSLLRFTQIVDL